LFTHVDGSPPSSTADGHPAGPAPRVDISIRLREMWRLGARQLATYPDYRAVGSNFAFYRGVAATRFDRLKQKCER
jgi:hypothetical protein